VKKGKRFLERVRIPKRKKGGCKRSGGGVGGELPSEKEDPHGGGGSAADRKGEEGLWSFKERKRTDGGPDSLPSRERFEKKKQKKVVFLHHPIKRKMNSMY